MKKCGSIDPSKNCVLFPCGAKGIDNAAPLDSVFCHLLCCVPVIELSLK